MEELSLHIEYLLLRHDCVIVPGLGAFIVRRQGARIDHSQGLVYPPTREVAFNREVKTDDGLLAHSLARRNMLPYEEGREMMHRAVAEIKEHLLLEGEVTLGHVGTLVVGEESRIQFHPYRRSQSEAFASGYTAASLKVAAKEKEEKREQHEEDTAIVNNEDFKADTGSDRIENAPIIAAPQKSDETSVISPVTTTSSRYYTLRIRKTFAHIAACMLLIVMVGISILLPSSSRTDSTKAMASVVPIEAISRTLNNETEKKEQVKISETESQTEAQDIESEELPTTIEEKLLSYYLVVATFRNITNEDFPTSITIPSIMASVRGILRLIILPKPFFLSISNEPPIA